MRLQKTDWGYIRWMEPEGEPGGMELSLRTGTVYIEPGKAMLKHVHYDEQFIYVIEGTGIGYINGKLQEFKPGAAFHMPAGCTHEFINTGETPVIHLLVASPVALDPDSLMDKTKPVPGKSEEKLYTAVEAVRMQFLENLHMAFAILDRKERIVLKSDYFPETCDKNCISCGKPESPCLRQSARGSDFSEQRFVCPFGLTIYRVPILWEEELLGWVQGGYIFLSYGKDPRSGLYDVPESGAFGILQLLRKVAKAIRNYCEFDQYQRELFEKEKSLSSSLDVQHALRTNLRTSKAEVADLQISNHFLFNTLNSMAAQALEGGMRPLYQSIIDLSKMLRYSVKVRGRQITLAVELDYLKSYLKLQQLRYREGFTWTICVENGIETAMVPFNFIQPVVENAFIHGFSEKKEKKLTLHAGLDNGQILIEIENNGTLLSREKCRQIRLLMQSGSPHGLSMVYEKLRMAYGEVYDVDIFPGKEEGACVKIRIPFCREERAEGQEL